MGWNILRREDARSILQKEIDTFLVGETTRLEGADVTGDLLAQCAVRATAHVGEPVIVTVAPIPSGGFGLVGYPLAVIAATVPSDAKAIATLPPPRETKAEATACYTCGKPARKASGGAAPRCGRCS